MRIDRLHYITQVGPNGESHAEMAKLACEAGVKWVQLRMKNMSAEEMMIQAAQTKTVCKVFGATFIINDHIELALEVGADGVHLGKEDRSVSEARALLGDKIIGGTANDIETMNALARDGVDYIGLGPFRFTNTKKNLSPILGLEGYQRLLNEFQVKSDVPVIAIGGIVTEDVPSILQTGIYGVAVSSVLHESNDRKTVVEKFYKNIQNGKFVH